MSTVSRCFRPVTLTHGQCPNDEWHFRGAAREIYSYLKLLAANHGGFVFASVSDIARHTKQWRRGQRQASKSHCERILRIFRVLGILGEYETRVIHGRAYQGRQFNTVHKFWATAHDGICDFKYWKAYEGEQRKYMGNQKDIVTNDGADEGCNDGGLRANEGGNDGGQTVVLTPNLATVMELPEAKNP